MVKTFVIDQMLKAQNDSKDKITLQCIYIYHMLPQPLTTLPYNCAYDSTLRDLHMVSYKFMYLLIYLQHLKVWKGICLIWSNNMIDVYCYN